ADAAHPAQVAAVAQADVARRRGARRRLGRRRPDRLPRSRDVRDQRALSALQRRTDAGRNRSLACSRQSLTAPHGVTVGSLLRSRPEAFGLPLELLAGGDGLDRTITSPHIQKTALALAGFHE